jgi:PAS domain-containing protein
VVRDSAVRNFRRPRRVEADARDRELAAIVANVPGAVYRCALDRNWTMEVFSDEIERISGYPASDFIHNAQRSFASVIHPDDRDDVDRVVRDAVISDSPYGLEFRSSARTARCAGCSNAANGWSARTVRPGCTASSSTSPRARKRRRCCASERRSRRVSRSSRQRVSGSSPHRMLRVARWRETSTTERSSSWSQQPAACAHKPNQNLQPTPGSRDSDTDSTWPTGGGVSGIVRVTLAVTPGRPIRSARTDSWL